ncbi:MAG: orotidine 5'-phosphate decarboxylase, partial [Pseudomonadota bacterium]
MNQFFQQLWAEQQRKKSFLCVGLDPHPDKIPESLGKGEEATFQFLQAIVNVTHQYACAYKPQ